MSETNVKIFSFKELKQAIQKCCRGENLSSTEFTDKYSFSMNASKLNQMLYKAELPFRVFAGAPVIKSKPISLQDSDIFVLSDYVQDSNELFKLMRSAKEYIIFSIFSVKNKEGDIEIRMNADDEDPVDAKTLFKMCNTEEADLDLCCSIMKDMPRYQIMVARRFSEQKEGFVYDVFFRSNRNISEYYKVAIGEQEVENGDEDAMDAVEE